MVWLDEVLMQRLEGATTRNFRYYDIVIAFYVTVQLASNFVAAGKIASIHFGEGKDDWVFNFGAGILVFPFGYIFADILTEVYGYAAARRAVWLGFSTQLLMSLIAWMVISFPPSATWPHQDAWYTVFSSTPGIVAASLVAFWSGELANSFVLSKMKILTRGRWLWMRTIGSTLVGQLVDSLIFYPLAFIGFPLLVQWIRGETGLDVPGNAPWSFDQTREVLIANFLLKVAVEVIATPWTYFVVGWLKRNEHYDAYDVGVNYSPFHVRFEGKNAKVEATTESTTKEMKSTADE